MKMPKIPFWGHKYYGNYCIDSNQSLHNNKDHQVLFVGGSLPTRL